MKRLFGFISSFLVIAFITAGLTSCAIGPTPDQALSPLQDAVAVRDTIILAKNALVDARSLGKISKDAYDKAWATAEDADRIVVNQIQSAHNGMVIKGALDTASSKVKEVKAVAGTP